MIRTQKGAFRATSFGSAPAAGPINGLNLYDTSGAPLGGNIAGWSAGSAIIDQVPFQILPNERWTIISFSISFQLQFSLGMNSLANFPQRIYGSFGKIRGAMLFGTDFTGTTGAGPNPVSSPAPPIPADLTNLIDLWDPDGSAVLPPHKDAGQFLFVENSIVLPTPRKIQLAEPIAIGIWMRPSLTVLVPGSSNFPTLQLSQGRWAVVYDDGQR